MSEYDDLIAGSLKPNPAQAARVGFTAAVDSNPDSVAEARRVAQRTGVPIDTVLNMPADMKRQDAVGSVDFDTLAQTSPATAALLADVDKAKLAHDNVDSLSGMEQLIRSAKRGWTAGLRGFDATEIDAAAQGLNSLAARNPRNEPLRPRRNFTQADPATLDRLTSQYSRQLGENAADFTRRTSALKGLEATGATKGFYEAKGWGDSFSALLSDPFEISGNVVAESLGIMAPGTPAIVAGGLAGGPVGLAGTVGSTSYQAEYGSAIAEELQKSGIDLNDTAAVQAFVATPEFSDVRRKAQIKAAVIGAFDAATAGVAGVRLRPSKTGNLAAQTGVQAAGGASGEVVGSAASGQEINASSVLAEAIGEIPGSIVDVATMAGRSALQGKQKADQAEQSAALIENLNQFAAADKLLQRSPDSFEAFVAAAAEDGPVDTVYVDGRMLMQSGMSPKLAEMSPSVREQLDRSILTGGLIAIPVSEYATRIAPTDLAPQLLDHLKTEADGFTRAEAQDFMANQGAELQAEVERILTDRQDADTFRASQDVVKADILGQLNTAGRFTPQVNEAYATLASAYSAVRAAQLGMTPEAFHAERGMRVQGAAVAGQRLDSPNPLDSVSEASNANGKYYVVATEGVGEHQVSHSSNGVFSRFKSESGKNTDGVLNEEGDFVDAATINRLGTGDAETRAYIGDEKSRDVIARLKILAQDLNTSSDVAASAVDAIGKIVRGEITADEARALFGENGNQLDPADPNILNQSAQDVRDLVVTHNLSADNLLHAVKMGGIPVPSLAITKKDHPLTGFGEITLIGSKELADPKGYANTKVFGADIYSPRYPRITFSFTPAMKKRGEAMVQDGLDATKSYIDWSEVATSGIDALAGNSGVLWTFLKEKGIEPTIVRNEVKPLPPALEPFANDTRHAFDLAQDPAFIEAAWNDQIDVLTKAYDGDRQLAIDEVKQVRASAESNGKNYTVRHYANDIEQHQRDLRDAGSINTTGTRYALQEQVRNSGLEDEYRDSVMALMRTINPDEKIFTGFTPSGNRKYIPHTLENVVKILKKELRGGENFNYGVGSIRAKFTPQFKSIDQIRKAKGRLLDKAGFEKVKDEIDNAFFALSNEMSSFHPVGGELRFTDSMTSMMYDAASMGVPRALKENGFDDVPAEHQKDIAEFLAKLRTLPTEYFEAKILRDVDLAEFSAAVVPEGIKQEVISALNSRGINDIRTYKRGDEKDRADKIGEFEHLFFQPDGGTKGPRGAFSPDTNTVTLLKNADLTTFLHEAAHYFFESDIQLASELLGKAELTPGEQQIVDDVARLLTWHGIHGDVTEQLRQWHTMDFEEQRSHHERTAESFEAYLFSGKAPSLELQPVFQRFAQWMVNVYKSLKDFLTKNPEAGKLSDEVRQVFDRMIATREEIALAEQARSMMPMFSSPETSGMDPDDYAKIQAQHAEATSTAVDELQAKGLRDLQWLKNAKGKQVARLKRESKALRTEVEMEARREVMSQPVYRAWDFLTRKLGQEDVLPALERKSDPDILDPTLDSLFVAIAKLGGVKKDEVIAEWGVDPKDFPESGLFGKPVWRLTDGLTLDGMGEALAQYGYLPLNEHGQHEISDLEERFLEELRGNMQYSNAYDYEAGRMLPGDQVINPAGLDAGRIDLAGLAHIGVPDEVANAVKARKMTAKEGMHPDLVATLFDFSSGDELVRTLAAATPPKEAITALADRMMLERHGELATPEAIELAADAAIHNDLRARMVTTEYNALAQATGQRKILNAAAKEYAAAIIARLKVRDIRPSQYANAEVRAAKAATKASNAGDLATAAAEKRNQVINTYATRAAYDAKDEVIAGLAYVKRRVTSATSQKNMRGESRAQLLALLDRFDLRKSVSAAELDRKQSLADWAAGEADRLAAPVPLLSDAVANETVRTHYKNLTVEEFRGLIDSIKQLEHMARREQKAYLAIRKMTLQQEVAAAVAEIREAWPDAFDADGKAKTETPLTHRYAKTFGDKLTEGLRHLNAEFVPMEELVGQLTAGKFGLLSESLFGRISGASDRKSIMAGEIRDRLAPAYAAYTMQEKRDFSRKVVGETGMTRENLLMLALYYGNVEGRQRLASQGFNDQAMMSRLSNLTEKDLNLAEAIWSLNDDFIWPQYSALNERTQGKAPAKVEAVPFQIGGRTVRGGYVKLVYDSQFDEKTRHRDSMDDAMAMIGGRANHSAKTNQGSSNERIQELAKMPLLELRAMSQAINEHMHDISYREAVADTVRVLRETDMANAIKAVAGKDVYTELLAKVNEVAARPADPSSKVLAFLNLARKNTVVVLMSGVRTALINYSGLVPALFDNRINAAALVKNIAKVHSWRMREMIAFAMEKSIYMRERNQQFTSDLQHEMASLTVKNRLLPEMGTFLIMMRTVDQITSTSVWLAGYESGKKAYPDDDARAIEYANSTVRSTQAGGRDVDTSKIMTRFGPWSKPFLMFYSFFNRQLGLLVRNGVISKQQWERGNKARAVGQFTAAYISIIVIPALINDLASGRCDDAIETGEGWGKCVSKAIAMNMAGFIPIVRDLAPYAWGMLDDSAPNFGLRSSPVTAYFEGVIKGAASAVEVAADEGDEKDTKSIFMGLAYLFGLPGKLMWDVTAGTESVVNDDAPPQSILFGPPKE